MQKVEPKMQKMPAKKLDSRTVWRYLMYNNKLSSEAGWLSPTLILVQKRFSYVPCKKLSQKS